MKIASVDSIMGNEWSSKAAAGDALQRVSHRAPILCVWLEEDGSICYSKANNTGISLGVFASFTAHLASRFWDAEA